MSSAKPVIDVCIFFSFIYLTALVESLLFKTKYWEEERQKVFLYDEVYFHLDGYVNNGSCKCYEYIFTGTRNKKELAKDNLETVKSNSRIYKQSL